MKFEKFDLKGKKMDEKLTLNDGVWAVPMNEDLVSQALYVYQNNTRAALANAKTRADVSGGGRKPWAQKGTGRARAGSTRSPVWRGGGVHFTPNDRNWKKKLSNKMRRAATKIILSKKLSDNKLKFIDIEEKRPLSEYREIVNSKGTVLIISDNKNVFLALRNLDNVTVACSLTVSLYDLLNAANVVFDSNSVSKLEERLLDVK